MGGSDDSSNLVYLSPRCHFIAHWILYKIFKNREMAWAFKRMCEAPAHNGRGRISGYRYEIARRAWRQQLTGVARPDMVTNNPSSRPEVAAKIRATKLENWKDPERRAQAADRASKWYEIIHPDGRVEIIKNLKLFCAEHCLNYSTMKYATSRDNVKLLRRNKGYSVKPITMPNEHSGT
jgi:hypothetical protein